MKTVKYLLTFLLVVLASAALVLSGSSQPEKKLVEKAITNDLDLLKNLDSETTLDYISYRELFPDAADNTELSNEVTEVFSLFFRNFDYEIRSITINQDHNTASADLKLTTLDADTLARDFMAAQLKNEIMDAAQQNTEEKPVSLEQRYLTLHSLLKNNTYRAVQEDSTITLINKGSSQSPNWQITHTDTLENELVGGLITYLSDPDLLSPESTLDIYLKALQEMDVEEMSNYLGLESILNTSDSAKNAIASALVQQFHQNFNYQVTDTAINGYRAKVDTELTTFDSDSILSHYEDELNTYLASADAVIDGVQKRYNRSHQLLLDSIENNQDTTTVKASFHLVNDGVSWKLENGSAELGNAIFGTLTTSPVSEDQEPETDDPS